MAINFSFISNKKRTRLNRCGWWIGIIWVLTMAKLCQNINEIDYLQQGTYSEYAYFLFYYVLSYNVFELYAVLGWDQTMPFWKHLEVQFMRLQKKNTSAKKYKAMNLTNDFYNTYSHSFDPLTDLSLDYLEINMSDGSFEYSYSKLYTLSKQFTEPIVFRAFASNPNKQEFKDNLIRFLSTKYPDAIVPIFNPKPMHRNRTTIRHKHRKIGQDYVLLPTMKLKDFLKEQTTDHIKFWKPCARRNTAELWDDFDLDLLQIPPSVIGGTGVFISNMPPKEAIVDENGRLIDEWSLTSDFHSDAGPSFFIQYKGRKLWRLIDIKYSHLMRPDQHGPYTRSFAYDLEHFNSIPRYEVILEEGDMIFFPQWMWHEVYVDRNCGFELSIGLKLVNGVNLFSSFKTSALFSTNMFAALLNEIMFHYNATKSKWC